MTLSPTIFSKDQILSFGAGVISFIAALALSAALMIAQPPSAAATNRSSTCEVVYQGRTLHCGLRYALPVGIPCDCRGYQNGQYTVVRGRVR